MTTRRFTSFEQIDTELEILAVSRQLSVYRLKNQLRTTGSETLRYGLMRSIKPMLRSLLISFAVKAIKKRVFRANAKDCD
ncbi:MAG: hypothetical protein RLZZ241_983 [Bacteroidota bacterium]